MDVKEVFGVRLETALRVCGKTPDWLAEQLKVDTDTVGQYFCGDATPDIVRLRHVSCLLDVSTDYLLGLK